MTLGEPWPLGASVNPSGHLELGGCDATALAQEFGTPLYVYDYATLVDRATRARACFAAEWPCSTVLYATKAYFSPFLACLYRDLGLGLDVTSEGEMEVAHRVGFPVERIYLHGNNKTEAEVRLALSLGISHVVIDNLADIELLANLAQELDAHPQVLVRVSPDIDPHTHKYLTTGIVDSKFGLPISTRDAARAFGLLLNYPRLQPVGLHAHIGSQIFDLDSIRSAVDAVLRLALALQERANLTLRELDLGGGWGVAYTEEARSAPLEAVAHLIVSAVQSALDRFRLSPGPEHLLVEPGRALIAQAAVALYRVGAVKEIAGARTYIGVDGGMGDNIRPALYGAQYIARLANKFAAPPVMQGTIAGRYCEQGDILVWDARLPRAEFGDLVAIPAAGAYQLPMASNYNLIPRPAVVLVQDGRARLLRRRETIDDLLACEVA